MPAAKGGGGGNISYAQSNKLHFDAHRVIHKALFWGGLLLAAAALCQVSVTARTFWNFLLRPETSKPGCGLIAPLDSSRAIPEW